jgi:hypothetical protein
MNTKLLMTVCAIMLGSIGLLLTFMPEEVSRSLNLSGSTILFQILGALYFGFAILNWTAKANLIGGIYSRPVAIGNFSHFLIGGLALIKLAFHNNYGFGILVWATFYLIFAMLFGYAVFITPTLIKK